MLILTSILPKPCTCTILAHAHSLFTPQNTTPVSFLHCESPSHSPRILSHPDHNHLTHLELTTANANTMTWMWDSVVVIYRTLSRILTPIYRVNKVSDTCNSPAFTNVLKRVLQKDNYTPVNWGFIFYETVSPNEVCRHIRDEGCVFVYNLVS
jgi:hypothetical protein